MNEYFEVAMHMGLLTRLRFTPNMQFATMDQWNR